MKKALSFMLAALMLLATPSMAIAADFPDYSQNDISKSGAQLLRVGFDDGSGKWYDSDSFKFVDDVSVVNDPDAAESVAIRNDESGELNGSLMYIWVADSSSTKTYNKKATSSLISRWDIDVETKGTDDILRDINIEFDSSGNAYIAAEFAPYLDSINSENFDVDFWLISEDKKVKGTDYTIKGSYKNSAVKIYEDDEDIDMTEDSDLLLDIKETVRLATLTLDYDIEVSIRLLKGKKVYLRASEELTEDDFDLMDEYDEIEQIIRIYSVNAKADSTKVTFDTDDYYVYGVDESSDSDSGADVELTYIGESGDELPLLDEYFLATSKISLNYDTDEPPVDEDDDDDDDIPPPPIDNYDPIEIPPIDDDYLSNPNGGPATDSDANQNFNPNTGR